jgi:lipopolysaccharide export LptBFGC system permease protein LptF
VISTLDRYIIRQFLLNFVILLAVLMMLFTVVDLILNLDEFLEAARLRMTEGGPSFSRALVWSLADYYGPLLVLMVVFFAGLVVTGAAGFTFAGLARTRETVAMVGSGISMYRIAAPVLVMGCLINGAMILVQEFAIPPLAPKLARSNAQAKYAQIPAFAFIYAADGAGNLVSAGQFDSRDLTLREVSILERSTSGRALRRVFAGEARWNAGEQSWMLSGASVVRYDESDPVAGSAQPLPDGTAFRTDLSPPVLLAMRASIYPRLLSIRELRTMIGSRGVDSNEMQQIIHTRFSTIITNVLVLAMTLPFYLLREPANLMREGIKASAVGLLTWGTGLLLLHMAGQQLNPVAAAWLPVIVFLPLAAILLQTVKT